MKRPILLWTFWLIISSSDGLLVETKGPFDGRKQCGMVAEAYRQSLPNARIRCVGGQGTVIEYPPENGPAFPGR